jgi:uroporphyrinogen-III synthase
MTGARIVITLSEGTLDGLDRSLDRLGARWVHKPLLTFESSEFWPALSESVAAVDRFGAVAISSPRSAALYAKAVREARVVSPPVWATGPGTARELRRLNPVHFVESPGRDGAAAALARMMVMRGVAGPVLFPCGEHHRDVLPSTLRDVGIEVEEFVCYRAVIAPEEMLRESAASGDVIVVASGRVARALCHAVPGSERPALVALGPVTAQAASSVGWHPAAVTDEPTIPSLLQALHGTLNLSPGARR